MIIGLTGGIASGKSTVSRFFKELGLEILDADVVAKDIAKRKDIVEKTIEIFGTDIVDKSGDISRERLRAKAFADKSLLKRLNSLIHPKVIEVFQKRKAGTDKNEVVVFDIPLLFETEMEYLCDIVVVVALDREKQILRVMERDKNSKELAQNIVDAQMPLEKKIEKADIVLYNNGTIEDLKDETIKIYNELMRGRR